MDMDDNTILQRVSDLSEEELRLEAHQEKSQLSQEDHERMKAIEIELDQCWDLLRRRRARRHAGLDPDDETVRPAEVVEKYLQ
jgi:hypothetical protein